MSSPIIVPTQREVALQEFDESFLAGLKLSGFEDPQTKRILQAQHILRGSNGNITSLKPLLPLLLSLNGEPYTLERLEGKAAKRSPGYAPFETFYRSRMPRRTLFKTGRQVAKSSNLAARGILHSACVPFFKTLYITPLFEMVRRFSANYIGPFIETSPVKKLFTGKGSVGSILQRTFSNHSRMIFSFAFLNADRTRGVSANKVSYDESACGISTYIKTTSGTKRIMDVIVGDYVESYTKHGMIEWDRVTAVAYHGYRRCFKVTLTNGRSLTLTAESWLATTKDWKRVSEIIESATASDGARDAAGRRLDVVSRKKREVCKSSQLETTRIQLSQIPDIICVRTAETQEVQELRLREMVQCLGVTDEYSIQLLQAPVLPSERRGAADKDDQSNLVESVDAGSSGVVALRRRMLVSQGVCDHSSHGGVHGARSPDAGNTSKNQIWDRQHRGQVEKPQHDMRALLDDSTWRGSDREVPAVDSPVHACVYAVQSPDLAATDSSNLLLLRSSVSVTAGALGSNQTGKHASTLTNETVLRQQNVQTGEDALAGAQVHGRSGTTEGEEPETTETLLRELACQPHKISGDSTSISRKTSNTDSDSQTKISSEKASRQTSGDMDMSTLQTARTVGTSRPENAVLSDVSHNSHAKDQTEISVIPGDIASIECVGYRHVYDLTTENNNAFIANGVCSHNCQDLDKDFIPIITETMSGSPYGVIQEMAGTPKGLENTIEGEWGASSQAEWCIKCHRCGYWNVPALSHDLDAMIGPWREDLSFSKPAVICAQCRKYVYPHTGRWVHAHPERRWDYAGYHIPQFIMPMHYADPDKWSTLLGKQSGAGNTPLNVFYNEVCGESYDTGSRIITLTDLKQACILEWGNTLAQAKASFNHNDYIHLSLGVDWGGGGEDGMSFTCYAVMGMKPDGKLDVIFGFRSLTPHDHEREARLALGLAAEFGCQVISHDYTGAGSLRETFMAQANWPLDRILPIAYVRAASTARVMTFKPPTKNNPRPHYQIDKSRALLLVCNQIKRQWIRFFRYDYINSEDTGMVYDFLALVDEKVDSRIGKDIYTIIRDPNMRDDFAQAVCMGACSLWHMSDKWPDIAAVAGMRVPDEVLERMHPSNKEPLWDMPENQQY